MGFERMNLCRIVRRGTHSSPAAVSIRRLAWALGLAIGCSGLLLGQVPGLYQINVPQSHIEIHLYKAGFLGGLGDNHLISLTHFSGFANLPKAQPWHAQVNAEASSLKVVDPWNSASDRKEVQDTMLGPKQLDVSHFPSITLRSLTFEPTGQDTTWRLKADLTLHGVTRPVDFLLLCHQTGDDLRVQGKKMLRLRDFNIEPYSRAFGAVRVKNEFDVTFDVVLQLKR
jgi:polyisoprenoid-binding protein YceI